MKLKREEEEEKKYQAQRITKKKWSMKLFTGIFKT